MTTFWDLGARARKLFGENKGEYAPIDYTKVAAAFEVPHTFSDRVKGSLQVSQKNGISLKNPYAEHVAGAPRERHVVDLNQIDFKLTVDDKLTLQSSFNNEYQFVAGAALAPVTFGEAGVEGGVIYIKEAGNAGCPQAIKIPLSANLPKRGLNLSFTKTFDLNFDKSVMKDREDSTALNASAAVDIFRSTNLPVVFGGQAQFAFKQGYLSPTLAHWGTHLTYAVPEVSIDFRYGPESFNPNDVEEAGPAICSTSILKELPAYRSTVGVESKFIPSLKNNAGHRVALAVSHDIVPKVSNITLKLQDPWLPSRVCDLLMFRPNPKVSGVLKAKISSEYDLHVYIKYRVPEYDAESKSVIRNVDGSNTLVQGAWGLQYGFGIEKPV